MIGYVVTRTSLHRLFEWFAGDLDSYVRQQAAATVQQELPTALAESIGALEVAMSHLDLRRSPVDEERLTASISTSSIATLDAISAAARRARRDIRTPKAAARAATVFRALTQVRPERHTYWFELSRALAQMDPPEYREAADALTKAIDRCGDDGAPKYRLYRAEMLASADPSPDDSTRAQIQDDITQAMKNEGVKADLTASSSDAPGSERFPALAQYLTQSGSPRTGPAAEERAPRGV